MTSDSRRLDDFHGADREVVDAEDPLDLDYQPTGQAEVTAGDAGDRSDLARPQLVLGALPGWAEDAAAVIGLLEPGERAGIPPGLGAGRVR